MFEKILGAVFLTQTISPLKAQRSDNATGSCEYTAGPYASLRGGCYKLYWALRAHLSPPSALI